MEELKPGICDECGSSANVKKYEVMTATVYQILDLCDNCKIDAELKFVLRCINEQKEM